MTKRWRSWVPVLKVRDTRKSVEFFCQRVGFTKDWEHQFDADFPLYASVSRDGLTLHLSEHGEEATHVTLVISVEDVDAAYSELCSNGLSPEGPPEDRPYDVRDFAFTDLDGHRFVVAMPLDNFDESPGRTNADEE
ncbi:Glyoxalase-like domain protein [Stieleria maiorica]|uniref:Bleomycin resistance protein n=1 Tax=Stieleria maiorica TaxID=2795974 RepID=A0A5B9MJJ6_9BACT|nr:glyoxalase superfamily protein [Stieleria maiorica]QEG01442.1 Glyoxalase-like domain protein [Stieleria maiorica]